MSSSGDCQSSTSTWILIVSTICSTIWAVANEILAKINNKHEDKPKCIGDCVRSIAKIKDYDTN